MITSDPIIVGEEAGRAGEGMARGWSGWGESPGAEDAELGYILSPALELHSNRISWKHKEDEGNPCGAGKGDKREPQHCFRALGYLGS